jgi:ubiquinone/menaquinone biosynthesis C-methylase UbiE
MSPGRKSISSRKRSLFASVSISSMASIISGVSRADALRLPFADASFDHVWSQFVTMNIADKAGLAREVARVLRPGGRFTCAELNQGPGGAPVFPLPRASEPALSFLVTPEAMHEALAAAGLKVLEQIDLSKESMAYVQEMGRRMIATT